MEIIKQLDVDLSRLAEELRAGKTLVYPTETCYGLGGDATNQMVVDRIFTIKERQREKALLVIVPNLAMIQELVEWDQKMDEIAKKYWPGPLTVVASVKPGTVLAQGVVSVDNTVAFRVTNHPFSAGLAKALNRPLISTSANITAAGNCYDPVSVQQMFQDRAAQPDFLIDGGDLPHRSPSTIIRIESGRVRVLRQGEIIVE
ncbi:MAG TPA: L-threonylcarbamoyladenylate synthase [Patescibacteria group bacterium]|nr:L-threonylcarbamoyladenylate synthase [Patescibacteria group bacterium]